MLRKRGYLAENIKAANVDDNYRLPNVHKIMPYKKYQMVPYKGQGSVKVYAEGQVKAGSMVRLSKGCGCGNVVEREVQAIDLIWDGQENWVYSPIRGMK